VDRRLEPLERAVVRGDDSAFTEGRGCYTSARVEAGRPRFADRHVARLLRASRELRIGPLDESMVRRALEELARAAFGDGDGAVRLQASRDGDGQPHLVGVPRELGPERTAWRAILVPVAHGGAGLAAGLKVSSRLTLALAGEAADDAGVDEALLLDGAGRLVEGARSNVMLDVGDGRLTTPPLELGAVSGVSRQVVIERVPDVVEREVTRDELRGATEVIAVNAVRGACSIVDIDGRAVGDGRPGPWRARLAEVLAHD
jgi:branched-subunit amino acid aminotransferase/4-amino-4-deoxychorismate lyase